MPISCRLLTWIGTCWKQKLTFLVIRCSKWAGDLRSGTFYSAAGVEPLLHWRGKKKKKDAETLRVKWKVKEIRSLKVRRGLGRGINANLMEPAFQEHAFNFRHSYLLAELVNVQGLQWEVSAFPWFPHYSKNRLLIYSL